MRSFKEIIKDCIDNNDNGHFETFFEEFINCDEFVYILNKCRNKEYIKACAELLLKEHSFKQVPPEFKTFKNALSDKIKEIQGNKKLDYRIKKNKIETEIKSLDSYFYNDSSTTLEETIKGNDKYTPDIEIENKERNDFIQELKEIGLEENTWQLAIMLKLYDFSEDNNFDNLHDCIIGLNVNEKAHSKVKTLLMYCGKRNDKVRKMISSFFTFSIYEKFVEYLIESNNNKLKISELIIDFNKIRNYLSILFYNDDINDKTSFIKKCDLRSVSSYEKEIHRILSLFKTDKTIFEFKEELVNYKPNDFAKIYDIHTVPNLITNFLILDVLKQYPSKEIKLANVVNILFKSNNQNNNIKDIEIKNFRKYTLLPRLKEMSEYGFIHIDNDKYILNAKFLKEEQKKVLQYIVPFFCGLYPFSSIGHFLANRLDIKKIKDIFYFEAFNIKNILDDCITYDLLYAINYDIAPNIKLKNEDTYKKIKPIEIYIEKEKFLLKFKTYDGENYLHDIEDVIFKDKHKNPIFSEIYSFYYKIFEEVIKEYNKDNNCNIKKILNDISEKHGTNDTSIIARSIDENILKMLSKLNNVSIPLTTLELRWLKTIMQDARFDLFVDAKDKECLEDLVKDVEQFDLSAFKIYDKETKKYKNIIDAGIPKGIDIDVFRKQLKELNPPIIFNVQENSFPELINSL